MAKTLTPEDIRDLLTGFTAAIELDQIRVDALPPEKFHRWYSDSMWRNWRRGHVDYINRLLPTVNTMPSALLQELAWLAITHDPMAPAWYVVVMSAVSILAMWMLPESRNFDVNR